MRRFILLLMFLYCSTYSQSNWFWQNPLPQGNSLLDVHYISMSTGWAAGNGGSIIKTTNGGSVWIVLPRPFLYDINGIFFVNSTLGFLIAHDQYQYSLVFKTTDGGLNWTEQNTGTASLFSDIFFTDTNNGFITGGGGLILRTSDSGQSWVTVQTQTTNFLNSIHFSDNLNGIIIGNFVLLRTTDGGISWNQINLFYNMSDVFLTSGGIAYIAGPDGLILKSTDGGLNWQELSSGTSMHLNSVEFRDDQNGLVSGSDFYNKGILLRTTNGGITWIIETDESFPAILDLKITSGGSATAVGVKGYIFKTADNGNTWLSQSPGTRFRLLTVTHVNSNIAYAGGYNPENYQGIILKTTNGGVLWQELSTGNIGGINKIFFINENTGFAAGIGGTILKTTNAGASWIQQTVNTTHIFYDIYFLDLNKGFAVGANEIYKTTNGGSSWIHQTLGLQEVIYAIDFINENTGWITGVTGFIMKTTDGGDTWIHQEGFPFVDFYDLLFFDQNNGIAVGGNCNCEDPIATILYTTNGGLNWAPRLRNPANKFYFTGVDYADRENITASGTNGKLFISTDGGITWNSEESGVSEHLYDVSFHGINTGITVGESGIILGNIGGIIPVELIVFSAGAEGMNVNLRWQTATELNNRGFEIERKSGEEDYRTIAFVEGYGTTAEIRDYSYSDKNLNPGEYTYRLKQIDYDGTFSYSEEAHVNVMSVPSDYKLEQAYPNPFNPVTIIKFSIAQRHKVEIKIYDIIGNQVQVLVEEELDPGIYQKELNASSFASGVYFYTLTAGSFSETKKITLLK